MKTISTSGEPTQCQTLARSAKLLLLSALSLVFVMSASATPTVPCDFVTYSHGDWAAKEKKASTGRLEELEITFPVSIGTTARGYEFTTADAVRAFLPNGGTPKALTTGGVVIDPKRTKSTDNTFAGHLLALTLNLQINPGMEDAMIDIGSSCLSVAVANYLEAAPEILTVQDLLERANSVFAGEQSATKGEISLLTGLLDRVNLSWRVGLESDCSLLICVGDDGEESTMAWIPGGPFSMGDSFSEGYIDEVPVHTVTVSAFYMDRREVTKALWDEVRTWALAHGYTFDNAGSGKAAAHPVHTVNWYDVVKWCNARSEKEGRVPAYYTDATRTTVYRTERVNVENGWVKWDAGYRLPTEAEWEKAARGGATGKRFPWSDSDEITHDRANYYSISSYAYDTSSTREFHPDYWTGEWPYTSPVGSFAPNGYGLYDMAGNVWEWCWDRYWGTYYSASPGSDPLGPESGSYRVVRGGSWYSYGYASNCRSSFRFYGYPDDRGSLLGFRAVLPPGQ
jgi:formylglycine-generating enzyme